MVLLLYKQISSVWDSRGCHICNGQMTAEGALLQWVEIEWSEIEHLGAFKHADPECSNTRNGHCDTDGHFKVGSVSVPLAPPVQGTRVADWGLSKGEVWLKQDVIIRLDFPTFGAALGC